MMYNMRTHTTSYLMAILMFALSLTVCDIFATQEKCQNFDLENECQVQGEKNGTCAIRLEIVESILVIFFRILATWEHTFMQKATHILTHTARDSRDAYRQNVQSKCFESLLSNTDLD